MTDKEEDKLSMYYAVIAACAKHNTAWQTLPAFANGYGEFQTEVDAISAAAETQQAGITGAAKDKSARRQTMAESAFPIAASVQAWATLNDNATLAGRIAFTLSDFLYGRDTESEERARLVHTEAAAILASLADYGVTQQLLDNLLAAIDAYKTTLTAPRAAITNRKTATAAIKTGFANADTILRDRMDKIVPILEATQPAFVTDYRNARIIVD
ncbi:MAG: hypothetical protein ACI8UO_004767 [Verrucomicrobiales bacterium]|jgi:hypothetical protein